MPILMQPGPTPSRKGIGIAAALASAIGYGSVGVMLHFARQSSLALPTLLAWRFTGTSLILMPLVIRLMWRMSKHNSITKWRPQEIVYGLLLGAIGFALQSFCYVGAVERLGAGRSAVLLYTYPAVVLLITWLMGGPTPRIMHALALGLAFLGCGLTVYADGSGLPIMGVALACAASVIYALYLILSHRQIQSLPPIAAAMLVSGGAALTFWSSAVYSGATLLPTALSEWTVLALMVVACTLLPLCATFVATRHLGPTQTAFICILEPVFATWLGVIVLSEEVSRYQLAGTAMVIAAALLLQQIGPRKGD